MPRPGDIDFRVSDTFAGALLGHPRPWDGPDADRSLRELKETVEDLRHRIVKLQELEARVFLLVDAVDLLVEAERLRRKGRNGRGG